MKYFILYIFLLFCTTFSVAQSKLNDNQKIDSLNLVIKSTDCDTCKIKILYQLTTLYGGNNPNKALALARQALTIAEKINNLKFIASSNRNVGALSYYIGDYNTAIEKLNQSQKLCAELNDKEGEAKSLIWLGNTYYSTANFDKALAAQLKSLSLYESTLNKPGIAGSLNGIANVYRSQHNLKKALEYYFKSLAIRKELDESINIAYNYNNIGLVYSEADSLAKSLEYHLKCLEIVQRENDKKGMSNSYGNIGEVYFKQKKYTDALTYLSKSLNISAVISDKNGMCASYSDIGKTYVQLGDFKNALTNFFKGVAIGKEIGDKDALKDCYSGLASVYAETKDFKNALEYFEQFNATKDTLMNEENSKNLNEMQMRFETDKKQKEIELLQKDKNIRELQLSEQETNIHRQRIIIYSVIGGLLLIIVLIFFIIKSLREKKKINIGLERKNIEINFQKNQIQEKNILITDSIDYARNIQNAILPSAHILDAALSSPGGGGVIGEDYFILFLPKDVVSGDFYWLNASRQEKVSSQRSENSQLQTADCILFAAVDCTGHGVPGAFMSVMAFNMLENIVAEKKFTQPSLILDELNKVVVETLHPDAENTSTKYGMDISLIAIDKNKCQLQFAGAHNPLIIIRAKEKLSPVGEMPKAEGSIENTNILIEIKADKTTIGMAREKFTNHSINLQKGDMLYLFTDGYADQKGGPENKKFFSSAFKELLTSIADKNPNEQKNILEKTFNEWKNSREQLDDVLVMGISV